MFRFSSEISPFDGYSKLQTLRLLSKVIPLHSLLSCALDLDNHLRKTIEKPGVFFMQSTTQQCHVKTSKILLWNAQMSSLTSNSYRLCRGRDPNVPQWTTTGTIAGKKLAGTQNIAELRSKMKTAASVYPNGSARWSKIAEKSQSRLFWRGDWNEIFLFQLSLLL